MQDSGCLCISTLGLLQDIIKNPSTGVTDSTRQFNNFESIKTYFGPEPRLSARYLFNDNSSFKFGFFS